MVPARAAYRAEPCAFDRYRPRADRDDRDYLIYVVAPGDERGAAASSQQNVIAVLVDDSRSMGLVDANGNGKTRLQNAEDLLNNELVPELSKKFQIRLYSFGHDAARIDRG